MSESSESNGSTWVCAVDWIAIAIGVAINSSTSKGANTIRGDESHQCRAEGAIALSQMVVMCVRVKMCAIKAG